MADQDVETIRDAYDAFAKQDIPAVLANVATPAGSAYVTVAMSWFSDSAVAGWAIVGRIISCKPVAGAGASPSRLFAYAKGSYVASKTGSRRRWGAEHPGGLTKRDCMTST